MSPEQPERDGYGSDDTPPRGIPVQPTSREGLSYARSGSTPNAEDAPASPLLFTRFEGDPRRNPAGGMPLSDIGRDVLAVGFLVAAGLSRWSWEAVAYERLAPALGILVAVAAVIAVHALRIGAPGIRDNALRLVRAGGQLPLLVVVVITLLRDAVLAVPTVVTGQATHSDGIGVAVALAAGGAVLAAEPRIAEGYLPHGPLRRWGRTAVRVLTVVILATVAIAIIVLVTAAITARSPLPIEQLLRIPVLAIPIAVPLWAVRRGDPALFVIGGVILLGMMAGTVFDTMFRLDYPRTASVATGWVWQPYAAVLLAVLSSRSFLRSFPLELGAEPWTPLALRAFRVIIAAEIAVLPGAVVGALARTVDHPSEQGPLLMVAAGIGALLLAGLAQLGRSALRHGQHSRSRNTAVLAATAIVLVGFFGVNAHTIAHDAAPSTLTGGFAMIMGLAILLGLTVPAPIRERYGAPDVTAMLRDLRREPVRRRR